MALTLVADGTQTAAVGTEHTLQDLVVSATYIFKVDKSNMASGDTLELRIYDTVKSSAGTLRVAYFQSFSGAQPAGDLIAISVPVPSNNEFKATLKQTTGTGRNYDWSVLKF